ncbi:MAG: hypothetical protein IJF27_05175 [Oscillospiraceae bacterium]|nr:hypothetical protein [Oscillospiraceae bacterium]
MKYDLVKLMKRAWKIFRQAEGLTFGEALHRAWLSAKAEKVNAQRIEEAKTALGIVEQTATWKAWRDAGYEVLHGSKALFGVDLIWGSKGDGKTYHASFFGASQVQPIRMAGEAI